MVSGVKLHTVVVAGAVVQIVLCAMLPLRWAVVPAAIILLNSTITTLLQLRSIRANTFMKHSVLGRTTAQIPSAEGTFGPDPATQGLVVFNLGVQWNHPLGVLAPGVARVSNDFLAMAKDLEARRAELGLLSVSTWRGSERETNTSFNLSFYFRDVESIHRFAQEDLHRRTWNWYNAEKPTHIGIYHETFVVPARSYETMYVNCHPVLMGRGAVSCEGKDGGGRWLNTLVSADVPALRTQYARLGRDEQGVPKELLSV